MTVLSNRQVLWFNYSFKWLLSQNGGVLVRLQVQNLRFPIRFAVHSNGVKSVTSCEPSQNGCVSERPHQHHQ
jgi:hypothetical protein